MFWSKKKRGWWGYWNGCFDVESQHLNQRWTQFCCPLIFTNRLHIIGFPDCWDAIHCNLSPIGILSILTVAAPVSRSQVCCPSWLLQRPCHSPRLKVHPDCLDALFTQAGHYVIDQCSTVRFQCQISLAISVSFWRTHFGALFRYCLSGWIKICNHLKQFCCNPKPAIMCIWLFQRWLLMKDLPGIDISSSEDLHLIYLAMTHYFC